MANLKFDRDLPQYCTGCGAKLLKGRVKSLSRFDPISGKSEGVTEYSLSCPKKKSFLNQLLLRNVICNRFLVTDTPYDPILGRPHRFVYRKYY